jgi:hypothetical protein
MHPEESARVAIERGVALGNGRVEPMYFELLAAEGPREETATVFRPLKLYDKRSTKFRLGKFHAALTSQVDLIMLR